MKTKLEKLKHCVGCRDNYYNSPTTSNTGYCWMLDSMKLVRRKAVPIDQRPPWNQPAQLVPSCYNKDGYVYVGADQTH